MILQTAVFKLVLIINIKLIGFGESISKRKIYEKKRPELFI